MGKNWKRKLHVERIEKKVEELKAELKLATDERTRARIESRIRKVGKYLRTLDIPSPVKEVKPEPVAVEEKVEEPVVEEKEEIKKPRKPRVTKKKPATTAKPKRRRTPTKRKAKDDE
tara:strand:+ start:1907 stop:2257 length:351 start_codon:yes stop_codon:yes gene_type:complete